jgi:hypothetical protein
MHCYRGSFGRPTCASLGDGPMLTFVRRRNFLSHHRIGWLMLLNLAMDYCNETFLYEIAAEFGKLIGRYREDLTSRTLHICVFW